jgi:excisionase family DNA binding protein
MTFLTTDDLAERLRTSPRTIRHWRQIGKGPKGVKIGRRVLYDAKEIDRWIERQARQQQADTPWWGGAA